MSESLTLTDAPRTSTQPLQRTAQPTEVPTPTSSGGRRVTGGLRSVFLGSPEDPRWARPLLWLLMLSAGALYLADLSNSGTANEFYAAAVKSGTESLKAWLFGSLDSANAITVDKPPVSLWLMVLSARIFGFSSLSMLLPQALLGLGTVALTFATVRRWSGPAAGLIAGGLVALTPVAALMFRFNNPDALLVFLMSLAAYAVVRAIDASAAVKGAAVHWMILAGSAIGFAFLTKMAQGLLVLPAFGLVYLIASPLRLRVRIGHLLAAAAAMVVSAGWFIALVALWPAGSRPYIGGSTNNSLWELALGYNGLGRIFGSGGGAGGGGGGGMFGGTAGILRMFNTSFGTQISWLIPAALIALVVGLVATIKSPRTSKVRAGLILWGSWLVVTMAVFSFMSGTIHPYYAVALTPAIAGLIAVAGTELWSRRDDHLARGGLALMIGSTAIWGFCLMIRDASGWQTWLAWTMLVGGVLGALMLAVSTGRLKKFTVAAVIVGSLAALAGSASFTLATASTGHTGSTPTAGPASVASSGMGGGARMGGTPPAGAGTQTQTQTGTQTGGSTTDQSTTGQPSGGDGSGGGQGDSSTNTELINLLNATTTRWSAAVIGDQSAAGYILNSSTAVMAIGGWGGSDNSPTLAQFQQYVADGDITYFVSGGNSGFGGGGGRGGDTTSSASEITAWVSANYTATTVGGTTVYDLTT